MSDFLEDREDGENTYGRPKPVILMAKDYGTDFNRPVAVTEAGGLSVAGVSENASGAADAANSTTTPLLASATFTGDWVTNDDPHIALNFLADQDGDLYLEFSPDGGTTITLSKRYDYVANEPRFDALIKMPGRSHRVRFVNGSTDQGSFVLLTSTGDSLFPYAVSERDEPAFAAYQAADVAATEYAILVDLSDRVNFPHNDVGRIDLHSAFFLVQKGSNTVGAIQLGVITRIDGTDADISFVQGVSFNSADARSFTRDRLFSSPLRLGQSGGKLTRVSSSFAVTNETAVNTGLTLPSAEGNITPALGDLVIRFVHTSGSAFTGTASIQYAGNVSAT